MTNMTSAIDKAHVYNDLSGLHELRSAGVSEAEKVQATAKQFESMMLNLMLKSMRKANDIFAEGNMLHSNSTRFYEDMLDQQLSLSLTRGEGLGLAALLAKQLSHDYSAPPSAGYRSLPDYPRHSVLLPSTTLAEGVSVSPQADGVAVSAQEQDILTTVDSLTVDLYCDDVAVAPPGIATTEQSPVGSAADSLATAALPVHFSSPKEFTAALYPVAQQVAAELGVDPKLLLAQAALETGWGKHMINEQGKPSFNLFGIKADSRWQGEVARVTTSEYRQGVKLNEQAEFRSYQSYAESFTDYLRFLRNNNRYQSALANSAEPKAFVRALQTAGYATDPQYANKIYRIYQQMGNYPLASDSGARERSVLATVKAEGG